MSPKASTTKEINFPMIKDIAEIQTLADLKKSLYWNHVTGTGQIIPAAVVMNWSLSYISRQIQSGALYEYIKSGEKRHAKLTEPPKDELPEWCKVGEMVFFDGYLCRILELCNSPKMGHIARLLRRPGNVDAFGVSVNKLKPARQIWVVDEEKLKGGE